MSPRSSAMGMATMRVAAETDPRSSSLKLMSLARMPRVFILRGGGVLMGCTARLGAAATMPGKGDEAIGSSVADRGMNLGIAIFETKGLGVGLGIGFGVSLTGT